MMHYRGNDQARLAARAELARTTGVPLIAVNDVLYHHPDRRELQDVLTCIREHLTIDKAGRRLAANAERHLKTPAEMARLFRDMPEVIEATQALDAALTFDLDELKYEYPDEAIAGFATPQDALVHLTYEGARQRYPDGIPDDVREVLAHEFALIAQRQYAPYFLTVYDIVRYARSQGILCQGRGSAANSTVCFCLGVTSVDPVRSKLLFERFISTERHEPPDIDVDFEHERREEVIQYLYRKYGRDHAGIAATVISYRGRSAIREIGKVFGLSEDTIGALSSSIWGMGGGSARVSEFKRAGIDIDSPRIIKLRALVEEIQSFPRHLSQHVGGFVITQSRLDEVMPIMNGAMDERTHVEWDKDDLDALGILKVDVLGLGMLTCIRKAFELCEKHYGLSFRMPSTSPASGGEIRMHSQASISPPFPPKSRRSIACCAAPTRSACSRSRAARRCRCCRGCSRKNSTISSSRSRSCGRGRSRATWCILICAGGRGANRSLTVKPGTSRDSGENARRAAVPGTGDEDRHRRRRLHAGRGRQAAPRHGDVQAHRHHRHVPRQDDRRHDRRTAIRATSPSAASARSKVSANTVFRKAMPRVLRCWSMPRRG